MDEEVVDNETLADELARLVREYEAHDKNSEEAWNLIADLAVCNADAISDALKNIEGSHPRKRASA